MIPKKILIAGLDLAAFGSRKLINGFIGEAKKM
jgi:hypothetical protein